MDNIASRHQSAFLDDHFMKQVTTHISNDRIICQNTSVRGRIIASLVLLIDESLVMLIGRSSCRAAACLL